MKKGVSQLFVIIIFLAVALFGTMVYLGVFSKGLFGSWDSLAWLTGMNDPEKLMEEGDAAYRAGEFDDAIKNYDRLLDKNPVYEKRDQARLMLALSYAAARNYRKASDELETLYEDPLCEEKSKIYPMIEYSEIPDDGLHAWYCCDLGDYGHVWVYGLCYQQCRAGCSESECGSKPS